jgi:hypothetical protein
MCKEKGIFEGSAVCIAHSVLRLDQLWGFDLAVSPLSRHHAWVALAEGWLSLGLGLGRAWVSMHRKATRLHCKGCASVSLVSVMSMP